jgi:hypothetical protein
MGISKDTRAGLIVAPGDNELAAPTTSLGSRGIGSLTDVELPRELEASEPLEKLFRRFVLPPLRLLLRLGIEL